jgi:endothelin-converting enzyme
MLIEEAAAIAPEIELKALIEGQAPQNSKIERVIVMTPDYLKELSVILAATPREVLQSYFIWKAVQSASAYVDADAVKPYRRFVNVLAGKVRTPQPIHYQPFALSPQL